MPGQVVADISVSLDGYVTGPSPGPERGLGVGGESLHAWVDAHADSPVDDEQLREMFSSTGAVLMGRRLFDVVDGPYGWDDDLGFGYEQDQRRAPHNVVVTHEAPVRPRHTSGFTFATDGIVAALDVARGHAGERDVCVMGGADVIGQLLAAGLVDELRLHVSPIVLGDGTPLYGWATGPVTFEQVSVTPSPHAVHVVYRPVRGRR